METSTKQVEANRRNARRSTGPRTRTGRAVSCRNALRHGLLSTLAVLPGALSLHVAAAQEAHAEQPHRQRVALAVVTTLSG
jgi:hypothetical protein